MRYFCIGTVFKNESHIMKEWLEHYFFHGVEHIYMINDNSNDNYMDILQPYIDKGVVTLFHADQPHYLGRQIDMYNIHFIPILKSTYWFGIFDMDEFLYSVIEVDLKNMLKSCENIAQIQIKNTLFGSNNLIEHPKYIVPNFTKRHIQHKDCHQLIKYIINTNYDYASLNIHHAEFLNKDNMTNGKFIYLDYTANLERPCFTLNHYYCQSRDFWDTIKCTRGDVNNYLKRDDHLFKLHDLNDIEDLRLIEQNKELYETILD